MKTKTNQLILTGLKEFWMEAMKTKNNWSMLSGWQESDTKAMRTRTNYSALMRWPEFRTKAMETKTICFTLTGWEHMTMSLGKDFIPPWRENILSSVSSKWQGAMVWNHCRTKNEGVVLWKCQNKLIPDDIMRQQYNGEKKAEGKNNGV